MVVETVVTMRPGCGSGRLKARPGTWTAAAGAVVGAGDAPGQGGECNARRQPKTSANGGGRAATGRAGPRCTDGGSVVKASFRRNRGKGGLGQARALSGARTGAARA